MDGTVQLDVITANVSWFVQNPVPLVRNHVSEDVPTRSVIFSVASHAWRILVMSPVTTFCRVDMIVLVSVAIPVQLSVELVTRILTHSKYFLEMKKMRMPDLFNLLTVVTVSTLIPWMDGQR